jgi:hypothetical protein
LATATTSSSGIAACHGARITGVVEHTIDDFGDDRLGAIEIGSVVHADDTGAVDLEGLNYLTVNLEVDRAREVTAGERVRAWGYIG